jgi:formamidopyrimidine-DNA glycosylase
MPELPDIELYRHALRPRIEGRRLEAARLIAPFLLRSVAPPLDEAAGRVVTGVGRLGKRIVITLENDLHLVLHLMIAGRLRWRPPAARPPARMGLLALDFAHGALLLTEAGSRRRASLHVADGAAALAALDPGGLEPATASPDTFRAALTRVGHTLKRALTDPRVFSGIGNAYSDEILHAARLSPFKRTTALGDEEVARLYDATRATLDGWTARLIAETGDAFPDKVTAFRDGMAVHGRHGQPCPACGAPVQRIVYAANEANYCASCQTGGRLLADRALSRVLREDWPKTLDELEALKASRRA